MINKVTALIVSFYRHEYLEICLQTLRETYPDIDIIVGDNGGDGEIKQEMCKKYNAEYFKLPFDCGICVGRNMIIDKIKTPYVLVGDDDFKYDKRASVEKMTQFMESNKDYSVVGGRIIQDGNLRNYQGFIELHDTYGVWKALTLDNYWVDSASGLEYKECDITFNFFVGRVEDLRKVRWDENIKVAYEHSTFFIDLMLAGYKTAFSPDPICIHKPPIQIIDKKQHDLYKHYRMRRSDKNHFFNKYGFQYCIDMNGTKTIPDVDGFDDISFCITMFERPESLKRLLISIATYYPQAKIYIGDQSYKFFAEWYGELFKELEEAGLKNKPTAYNLQFDCGLSFARNYLVEKTRSKYVLILEEDFEFTESTHLNSFTKILDVNPEIGMVGGMVMESGIPISFEHDFQLKGTTLKHVENKGSWWDDKEVRYKMTESVMNFFLARREIFNEVQWDNDLKIEGEHTDFMLKMKDTDWKIAYTDQVSIKHDKIKDDSWNYPRPLKYKDFRRRDDFLKILLTKRNLKKIVHLDGYTIELKDGVIYKG